MALNYANDNTTKWLFDTLNGKITRVDTLAKGIGKTADEALEQARYIIVEVRENYTSKSDFDEVKSQVTFESDRVGVIEKQINGESVEDENGIMQKLATLNSNVSQVTQTATAVTAKFESVEYLFDENTGIAKQVENIKTWIQEDASGVTIGREGDPYSLRVSNSGMQIMNNGTMIAEFSGGRTIIPEGAPISFGRFQWTPRANGHLSLLYVG